MIAAAELVWSGPPNPDNDHSNTWTAILLDGCGDELHRSNPIRDFYAAHGMLVNLGFRPVERNGRIDFYEPFDPHADAEPCSCGGIGDCCKR